MLFRIVTGEDWNRILHDTMDSNTCTKPANANFFHVEIANGNLLQAIHLIGCFSTDPPHKVVDDKMTGAADEQLVGLFRQTFWSAASDQETNEVKTHPRLFFACMILRMLYDMAIDHGYEKQTMSVSCSSRSSESDDHKMDHSQTSNSKNLCKSVLYNMAIRMRVCCHLVVSCVWHQ